MGERLADMESQHFRDDPAAGQTVFSEKVKGSALRKHHSPSFSSSFQKEVGSKEM